ncbi:hypothetical protein F5146DRAFT_1145374 [Armillaria mellea]|nr:hypothetical protein F5146DRAFT_1145374 [Armillaria mellea]
MNPFTFVAIATLSLFFGIVGILVLIAVSVYHAEDIRDWVGQTLIRVLKHIKHQNPDTAQHVQIQQSISTTIHQTSHSSNKPTSQENRPRNASPGPSRPRGVLRTPSPELAPEPIQSTPRTSSPTPQH